MEDKSNKTVINRTQAITSNWIEITSQEDIGDCLGTVMKMVTFVGCGWKYGIVEVKFVTKEEPASHAKTILRNEEVTLLLTYKRRRKLGYVLVE